jgi:TRAP-type C4-dicarboxylate transport system permease small subunit
MKKTYRLLVWIADIISRVSILCMMIIVALISINVFLRYMFNTPLFGVYEIVEQAMFCLVFTSFAYAQTKKRHVHVTMIISKLPHIPRFICYSVTQLLSFGITCAFTYAAFVQAAYSLTKATTTASLLIPLFPFFCAEVAAMCIFSFVLLADAAISIIAIRNQDCAQEIQASWS